MGSIVGMRELLSKLNMKDKFIGSLLTIGVGLLGWTTLNTHKMVVHMAKYEANNVAAHERIEALVTANILLLNTHTELIEKNTIHRIQFEAILPKELNLEDDGSRVKF